MDYGPDPQRGQSANEVEARPLESQNTDATSTKITTACVSHSIQAPDHRVHSENLVHLSRGHCSNVYWINLFGQNVPAIHRSRGSRRVLFHRWIPSPMAPSSFIPGVPPALRHPDLDNFGDGDAHVVANQVYPRPQGGSGSGIGGYVSPWPIICEDYPPACRIRSSATSERR